MTTIIHITANIKTQRQVREALENSYTLVSVADAPTAIQYCAMIHPDLIVIDARMPDVLQLSARLTMFMPTTPMLMLGHPTAPAAAPAGHDPVFEWSGVPLDLQRQVELILAQGAAGSPPASKLESQIAALSEANQRLASLNAVSALIGTSLDLEHLTDEILRQIEKTVDFDSATLFLLKGSVLEAAASRGLHTYRRGLNVFTRSDNNSAWQVVKNKLPLVINDVTQSKLWQPTPELDRVRAWLGVPLIYKDRVVGVLTLDKNERNSFSDADARHVFTLAFQIAIAVENAQLFEEWESQAARLKLINEVNQELTSILDAGSLYRTLAQALADRLEYDRVAIFEMAPTETVFRLRACACGPMAPYAAPEQDFVASREAGLIGEVVRSGRSVLVRDLAEVAVAPVLPGMPVRSVLLMPMFVDNRLEAVVNVESRAPNAFNDHDLWTVSSLATHAAAILENARLYHDIDAYSEKLQRTVLARTQRLQAIKNISQAISQGVGVDELLQVVGQRIRQIFADATDQPLQVVVALLNGSRLTVRNGLADAADAGLSSLPGVTYRLDFGSVVGQVIQHAQSTVRHGVDSRQIFSGQPLPQPQADASLMVVPLITAGKTIGVILVSTPNPAAFDEDDLETLETVAFQVASAIEHARLLRKTREMAIVDERTRLARDMHDGIAQNLAYLLIQVDRCLGLAPAGSKLEQQLESIGGLLEQNIEELRRNIFDLRPVELEGESLVAVLENFVLEFGRRWNLKTECRVDGEIDSVPPAVESTLYRVLQEALSNARRHANCSGVSVKLLVKLPWLILSVADDGQGFEHTLPENALKNQGRGLGLISMRERVESVGGHFEISSAAGRGTRVEAWLPLEPVALEADEQELEQ